MARGNLLSMNYAENTMKPVSILDGLVRHLSPYGSSGVLVRGAFSETAKTHDLLLPSLVASIDGVNGNGLVCGNGLKVVVNDQIFLSVAFKRQVALAGIRLFGTGLTSISLQKQINSTDNVLTSLLNNCTVSECPVTANYAYFNLPNGFATQSLSFNVKGTGSITRLEFVVHGALLTDGPACDGSSLTQVAKTGEWEADLTHAYTSLTDSASLTYTLQIPSDGQYQLLLPVPSCSLIGVCPLRDYVAVTVIQAGVTLATTDVNQRSINYSEPQVVSGMLKAGQVSVTVSRSIKTTILYGGRITGDGVILRRIGQLTGLNGFAVYDLKGSSLSAFIRPVVSPSARLHVDAATHLPANSTAATQVGQNAAFTVD